MPQRIHEDHKIFRDALRGNLRRELQKRITTGHLFRDRGKNGKVSIPLPQINLPRFRYGKTGEGVGRGPGKKGDVVGEDPAPGKGGKKAGKGASEGMMVDIDLEIIMKILKEELELPNLKPKPSKVFEETRIKYNGISKVGPRALLHRRKTMQQALKRSCATGEFNKKRHIPGYQNPVRIITPIKDDFRYRQWNEERIPCSNAVIFFARDGSGSMNQFKTEIVSDIAWWIESYIRCFYKKVRREYIWHDTRAKIVDENTFYGLRFGGGTMCSTAVKLISEQFKHRFPPSKWNIYVFYFSDGDNWGNDNERFLKIVKEDMNKNVVNLFGMAQILSWRYENSVKAHIDAAIKRGELDPEYVRTTEVARANDESNGPGWYGWYEGMPEEERDAATKSAIMDLLGRKKTKA